MLFAVCVSFSIVSGARAVADDIAQSPSRKTASGWVKKEKTGVDFNAAIQQKLQRVLANQELILQKADAVKAELGVIKIRTSVKASACP